MILMTEVGDIYNHEDKDKGTSPTILSTTQEDHAYK